MAQPVREIMARQVRTCPTTLTDAARIMRQHAVRRLPVTVNGEPVGAISLGDLAIERDPQSALAEISAKPGNE